MGAKPHKEQVKQERQGKMARPDQRKRFSLVSLEPGEALRPGLVFCVKEEREHMLTRCTMRGRDSGPNELDTKTCEDLKKKKFFHILNIGSKNSIEYEGGGMANIPLY